MRVKKSVCIQEDFDSYIIRQVEKSKLEVSYSTVLNGLLAKAIGGGK